MPNRINLTVPSYVVLGMVEAMGAATPYDMKQLASISLDHFRSVRHAQLYSEPDRLTAAGYLTVEQEESGRRRKCYSLTDAGRNALERWRAEPAEQVTELRDEGLLKIFFGADPKEIANQRLGAHRTRLAEFERLLEEVGPAMTDGQRLVLRAGARHERSWIKELEAIASGEINGEP